jgi:hypothetical protein
MSASTTPELAAHYVEAIPLPEEEPPTSCTSSAEAMALPLSNTVYAKSGQEEEREIIVDPVRIRRSLESLQKNRSLQKKGLG